MIELVSTGYRHPNRAPALVVAQWEYIRRELSIKRKTWDGCFNSYSNDWNCTMCGTGYLIRPRTFHINKPPKGVYPDIHVCEDLEACRYRRATRSC